MEEHVGQPMAGSLLVALASVPDPRSAHGRRHPLGAILALAVCGMLCGDGASMPWPNGGETRTVPWPTPWDSLETGPPASPPSTRCCR